MQQIHVIEQGDMSIDDYYSAYDRLMGSLTSMVNECTAADCPAHKFLDRFLTYRFVMGVKPEFDSIRTQLLHNSSTLAMDQALAALLAEEKRLQSLSSFSPVTTPHNVLAASQRITVPRGTSSEPCKHCGKTTHLSANCFRAYPEKLAEFMLVVLPVLLVAVELTPILEMVMFLLLLLLKMVLFLLLLHHLLMPLSQLGFLILVPLPM
jgi:hypothetical protein